MSEFLSFVHLGYKHIVNAEALDHILFLLALAAIYRGRDWRDSLWVISAFTVGHSVTLALAATGEVLIPQRLTEFLIPLTIVAMGVENVVVRARRLPATRSRCRPLFAGVFGLVHGTGFAGYLQQLFIGSVVIPLFGFNVGIELGQLVVLAAAGLFLAAFDRVLLLSQINRVRSYRLRVLTVSLVVVAIAAEMAAMRRPW